MNQQVRDIAWAIGESTRLADMLSECEDTLDADYIQQELLDSVMASEIGVDTLYITLKGLDGKAEYYKELAKELSLKAATIAARKEDIESAVLQLIQSQALPKRLVGTTYRINACNNSAPSLVLTKEEEELLIKAGYTRTKVELDKKAVIEDIVNGEMQSFDSCLQRGMHLRLSK